MNRLARAEPLSFSREATALASKKNTCGECGKYREGIHSLEIKKRRQRFGGGICLGLRIINLDTIIGSELWALCRMHGEEQ